jgi:prepilin-type N-terminal cleavage/methylation domain-containing protein
MKKNKGFTLIELLIVIAIIGLLATLGVASLRGALVKSRDAKRKSDIKAIQTALEIYYSDKGYYIEGTGNASTVLASLIPQYIKEIPEDPVNTGSNIYTFSNADCSGGTITTANQRYLVQATLENQNDPDRTGSV